MFKTQFFRDAVVSRSQLVCAKLTNPIENFICLKGYLPFINFYGTFDISGKFVILYFSKKKNYTAKKKEITVYQFESEKKSFF